MENIAKVLGYLALLIIVLVYNVVVSGLIVYKFVLWFLCPIMGENVGISYPHAIGAAFLIGLFKQHDFKDFYFDGKKIKEKQNYYAIYAAPWIILAIGYVFHLFI